ncbi:MAG: phosphoribosylanthranilate isomerase [Muribaculaceae bacterium]
MIVKVCGLRDETNIKQVIDAGANWIGMIFWQHSPRYVSTKPSFAGITRVGVFVDETQQNILAKVADYNLDLIQLHGQEQPSFINNLRNSLVNSLQKNVGIIKAISIGAPNDFKLCKEYDEAVDFFLFDTKCAEKGGSGKKFQWQWINEYNGSKPFLVSGGIGAEDVSALSGINHPLFYGVDINSKFENSPGIKDAEAVRKFIKNINETMNPSI